MFPQSVNKFDMERFNLKKINNSKIKQQVKMSIAKLSNRGKFEMDLQLWKAWASAGLGEVRRSQNFSQGASKSLQVKA
jgi:hypothetical protein